LGIGDWGLGIGDWGLGIGDWGQSPIPNPQSPIPNPQSPLKLLIMFKKINLIKFLYYIHIKIKNNHYYIIIKNYRYVRKLNILKNIYLKT